MEIYRYLRNSLLVSCVSDVKYCYGFNNWKYKIISLLTYGKRDFYIIYELFVNFSPKNATKLPVFASNIIETLMNCNSFYFYGLTSVHHDDIMR